jgi:phosphoglycerol transferase MdoB-like AlkP superfamily enzyme
MSAPPLSWRTRARLSDWSGAATVAAALLVLNAALTFENVWPTPAIRWTGGISVELAACVLLWALIVARTGSLASTWPAWLSGLWIVLTAGRYAEVTAPALYGREVNLYWDLRIIPDVVSMVTRVSSSWLVALAASVVALSLVLVHLLFRWAFNSVRLALLQKRPRRVLAIISAAAIVLFAAERLGAAASGPAVSIRPSIAGAFPAPVLQTYGHQAALVLAALRGSASIPASPRMESTFANIDGADVLLVFVESYGAVSLTPGMAAKLASSRRQFESDIRGTGRDVASAYIESPTFGGSSWLAHLSLLTGVEVRDSNTSALLMTERRQTLVTAFARHGYRTIALMPGLRHQWPEGAFYGFDEIYGAERLAYGGPEFGWFAVPDQFSLARLDALENPLEASTEADGSRTRARFVFFPSISTHFPFSPTPPYQPDWARMLTPKPYDGPALVRAYSRQPDWMNFAPGYIDALAYDVAVFGGYLRHWPHRDLVMILIGDHQPPAVVSGEGASWDVPVHVITSRRSLLDRLEGGGFRPGLLPERPAIARMHAFLPLLLEAFGPRD